MFVLKKEKTNSIVNITMWVILFMIIFFVLYIWASFIIPFIIALLFSLAIIGLSNFYSKLRIWKVLSFILSILTYIFIFWLIWKLINSNIEELIRLLPEYQVKVLSIIYNIFDYFNIQDFTGIKEFLAKIDLQYVFWVVLSWVTSIFSSTWVILFYVMFILLEYRYFWVKLKLMITDENKRRHILHTINKIKKDVKSYFVIKTIVSLVTSIISYFIMVLFGLDFAIFWAFLIFIWNYIPNIWAIISVPFPMLLALIQFWMNFQFIFITIWLIWIQILTWNIIEPKFIWNKLNLSPLVIILALTFWGSIWWIVGMILAVPIMVIINIILSEIPSTHSIAVLLSEKWELQIASEEVAKERKKLLNKIKDKFKKNK